MRVIDNECLKGLESPIVSIMNSLHNAIVNVAPERKGEFNKTFDNFTLKYLNDSKCLCRIEMDKNTDTNTIELDCALVEVIWCASYAHLRLYLSLQEKLKDKDLAKLSESERSIDLNSPEYREIIKLLEWAKKKCLDSTGDLWPLDFPKPSENPPKDSIIHFSNELCLCAVAFILHHELAHIRLKNETDEDNIKEIERQADIDAAEWILNKDNMEDKLKRRKRLLGIATAFIVLNMKGIYSRDFSDKHHPPSYDRLMHTLQHFIDEDETLIWAFIAYALSVHISIARTSSPNKASSGFQTFLEWANAIANYLADFSSKNNLHQ